MSDLRPELIEVMYWLQEQLDAKPFADVGVNLAQHGGVISRIDYSLTEKRKPSSAGTEGG